MVSIDSLLDGHEVAVRSRVEELRVQAERVAEALAEAEQGLANLAVTRATLAAVVAGRSLVVDGPVEAEAPLPQGAASAAPVGVPTWREDLAEDALPEHYRGLWLTVRRASGPVRAKELAAQLGLGTAPAKVEGVRSKLKRLVVRGWASEVAPGAFAVRMVAD